MRIAMIGAGYVGLVSAACFADFGHSVACIDTDKARIDALKNNHIPIYEPGLEEMIRTNQREGRLHFSMSAKDAVQEADAVFLAVGTPSRRGDGYADLSYVYQAARDLAPYLRDYTVIVTKSTVPVGTGDEVERIIREIRPDAQFAVVSNPEFLREGAAIGDFKRPDRIIIGADDPKAKEAMSEIYRPLFLNQSPIVFMARRAAELTKYATNAFLATKITFINEMADLCEQVGVDVQQVAHGLGLDNRVGPKFLHAGPGYGGSCFPKDTTALMKTAQDYGVSFSIVESVVAGNERRKRAMARKVITACGGAVRGKTVALLGLTFKPNTDDMREAPSLTIIQALLDAGAHVRAYDPKGMEQARAYFPEVEYADDPYGCAHEADALVILTEWEAFRALQLDRLRQMLKTPVLIDLRNVYSPEEVVRSGMSYVSVGRAAQPAPVAAASKRAVA
jgi:UDPglucose 6-dehydrogenase